MDCNLLIVKTKHSLQEKIALWRKKGTSIGLVPTMGFLHEGHFSLIRKSLKKADKTVVTIFLNPLQFGPIDDFDKYPRNENKDLKALEALGVELVFMPSVEEMYPFGSSITKISVPVISDLLEGHFRPGFFDGVATVVGKLFAQILPDYAFFGEKDFQQLLVIKQMAKDLDFSVEIINCPTIRENDGLALSSRNSYLSHEERKIAPLLYQISNNILKETLSGKPITETVKSAKIQLLKGGFTKVDYITICDSADLREIGKLEMGGRILGAAHLGNTRLIDNIEIT